MTHLVHLDVNKPAGEFLVELAAAYEALMSIPGKSVVLEPPRVSEGVLALPIGECRLLRAWSPIEGWVARLDRGVAE